MIPIEFKEKTISSKKKYTGSILNLRVDKVKLKNGHQARREIVEHSGGVTVIPLLSEKEIILVRQYRHAADQVMLELPAGKLEPGENPKQCMKRELREETGYTAAEIKKLFSFYTTPAYSSELLHMFLARELDFKGQDLDDGEFVEIQVINKSEIMDLIFSGRIRDAKTIAGLMYVLRGAEG